MIQSGKYLRTVRRSCQFRSFNDIMLLFFSQGSYILGSKFYFFLTSSVTVSYYFPKRLNILEVENMFPFITKDISLYIFWAIIHISVNGNLAENFLTSCLKQKNWRRFHRIWGIHFELMLLMSQSLLTFINKIIQTEYRQFLSHEITGFWKVK